MRFFATLKQHWKWTAFGVAVVLVLVGGYFYIRHSHLYPSTADAYVRANVVRMAAEVSARVAEVHVDNFQHVDKGELLVRLDPSRFEITLQQAQARLRVARQQLASSNSAVSAAKAMLEQRKAQLSEARDHARRISKLVDKGVVPEAEGESARTGLQSARAAVNSAQAELNKARRELGATGENNARVQAAEADVAKAKLDLEHTRLTAPAAGMIAEFDLRPGTMVQEGQPLFALVEDDGWHVDANFKETDLERLKPGMPVSLTVDMYPDHVFHGAIQRLSPASGASFSLLPSENATGNWVKVTQRFPIRISIDDRSSDYPLRIGASTKVTVDTTGGG